ncbi:uncharacterized protein [Ptychodera flava]|uniref:uncharacterized protein n=1 Tax=Ptychodera flava TaxID=63121 RepID=UPI003969D9DC
MSLDSSASTHVFVANDTLDVTLKGCFCDFNTVACVRNGLLSLFMTVTAIFCIAKLIRLFIGRHRLYYQYAIFGSATIECILCVNHWVYAHYYSQLDFAVQFIKLLQFLIVINYYFSYTSRLLKRERLINRVVRPFLASVFVYFTVVSVLGVVYTKQSWVECLQPYWLLLSTVEFLLVQVFVLAAVFISKKLDSLSTLDTCRKALKKDLWGLVIVFELSATVTLVYDIIVKSLGTEENGCSGIFLHMQSIYTTVYAFLNIFKVMLPIWAMLIVFHAPDKAEEDELHDAFSDSINGNFSSVFCPTPPRGYKRLSYPDLQSAASQQYTSPPKRSQSFPVMPPIEEESDN